MEEISLLFAVEAEQYLLSGMIDDAIELCVKGIKAYPGYAAGYSILAMAYKQKGEIGKAKEAVITASVNQPFHKHIASLKNEIVEEKKSENSVVTENTLYRANNLGIIPGICFSPFSINIEHSNFELRDFITKDVPTLELPKPYRNDIKSNYGINNTKQKINENDIIVNLSKRLENAVIPLNNYASDKDITNIKSPEEPKKLIITETMAAIYIQQNLIAEAITAYRQLAENSPVKKDYYYKKIKELESKQSTAQSE